MPQVEPYESAETGKGTDSPRYRGLAAAWAPLLALPAFQKMIFRQHLDGIDRSRLGKREGIGAATVERYLRRGLQR